MNEDKPIKINQLKKFTTLCEKYKWKLIYYFLFHRLAKKEKSMNTLPVGNAVEKQLKL